MNKLIEKLLKDKNGRIVLIQKPNIYIWIWLGLYLIAKIIDDKETKTGLQIAGNIILLYWAWLEVSQGVNYFRRLLGAVVGAGVIAWFIRIIIN